MSFKNRSNRSNRRRSAPKLFQQQQQQQQQQAPQLQQQYAFNNMNNNNMNNNFMQYSNVNNNYMQQQQIPQQQQQQGLNANSWQNSAKRANRKKTGKKLAARQTAKIPRNKMKHAVELDSNINQDQFLQSVQSAYGSNARVEINSVCNNYNNNMNRQQIQYQVVFDNDDEAEQAFSQNAVYQEQVAQNLGIKGSAMAFDKPSEPKAIDGITLELDSDSSSILCGACLIYDDEDRCLKVVHYSDRNYNGVIKHSGDTQVHGKSVHTIKLSLSDLDEKVKQLFFTLCSCGPSNLSHFKEPVISLYENNEEDINLVQYGIEQAGKSQSVVMCRLFRSGNDWSIQALGSEEWHIQSRVCMAYQHAKQLIAAHLKVMRENDAKKKEDEEKEKEKETEQGQNEEQEQEEQIEGDTKKKEEDVKGGDDKKEDNKGGDDK